KRYTDRRKRTWRRTDCGRERIGQRGAAKSGIARHSIVKRQTASERPADAITRSGQAQNRLMRELILRPGERLEWRNAVLGLPSHIEGKGCLLSDQKTGRMPAKVLFQDAEQIGQVRTRTEGVG